MEAPIQSSPLPTGKVFANVSIEKVEPDGITIMTDAGIEKLKFSELTPELQQRLGYDAAKAADFAKEQQAQQAQTSLQSRQWAAAEHERQQAALQEQTAAQEVARGAAAAAGTAFTAKIQVIRTLPGGVLAEVWALRPKVGYRQEGATRVPITITEEVPVGSGFVAGVLGVADDESYKMTLYPAGTYQYANGFGDLKTARAYATSARGAATLRAQKPTVVSN